MAVNLNVLMMLAIYLQNVCGVGFLNLTIKVLPQTGMMAA